MFTFYFLSQRNKSASVYGYDNGIVKYWKNGTSVLLTDASKSGRTNSIVVVGSDVYVAGVVNDGNFNSHGAYNGVATYWKNGVATALTDGSHDTRVKSLFVDGNDIYVAGAEESGPYSYLVAKYWKNGVETVLSNGTGDSEATSIFVTGGDIYVAGNVGHAYSTDSATYWKNGHATTFNGDVIYFNSIYVVDTSVYVAGREIVGINSTVARYWKNGIPVSLTDGTSIAGVNAIMISNGDVYAAGYDQSISPTTGTYSVAKYWKNGVAYPLTNGPNYASAESIFVYGTEVFVCGYDISGLIAKYWHKGVATTLGDGKPTAVAYSIFVK